MGRASGMPNTASRVPAALTGSAPEDLHLAGRHDPLDARCVRRGGAVAVATYACAARRTRSSSAMIERFIAKASAVVTIMSLVCEMRA